MLHEQRRKEMSESREVKEQKSKVSRAREE